MSFQILSPSLFSWILNSYAKIKQNPKKQENAPKPRIWNKTIPQKKTNMQKNYNHIKTYTKHLESSLSWSTTPEHEACSDIHSHTE